MQRVFQSPNRWSASETKHEASDVEADDQSLQWIIAIIFCIYTPVVGCSCKPNSSPVGRTACVAVVATAAAASAAAAEKRSSSAFSQHQVAATE